MDEIQAKHLTDQLLALGEVGGWTILGPLGNGKSAVVMLVEQDSVQGALKVFHPELIEKFGADSQLKRIDRELSLKGKDHPHLVKILGVGQCPKTKHIYVAMEALEGTVLTKALNGISRTQLPILAKQLAEAAKFLEEQGLVHRDIKPDNIILVGSTFDFLKLMDLGVVRPLGDSGITDGPFGTPFIGTLRYSPPEFLHGKVEKSTEGWRAVTFYQMGAVLHDLIMRQPIFPDVYDPYPELVRTIDEVTPKIEATDVDKRLVGLAVRCLVKNPRDRLRLVDWEEFFALGTPASTTLAAKKAALAKKQQLAELMSKEPTLTKTEEARLAALEQARTRECLRSKVDHALEHMAEVCPPTTVTTTAEMHTNASIRCVLHKDSASGLKSDLHCEFSVAKSPDGEAVTIFARGCNASPGSTSTPPAWTDLGAHDNLMTGSEERIEAWIVDFIEAAIDS